LSQDNKKKELSTLETQDLIWKHHCEALEKKQKKRKK